LNELNPVACLQVQGIADFNRDGDLAFCPDGGGGHADAPFIHTLL
jgi:hypothetical protein